MKWHEVIVECDEDYSVMRFETEGDADKYVNYVKRAKEEAQWNIRIADGPYLVDSDSTSFFDYT